MNFTRINTVLAIAILMVSPTLGVCAQEAEKPAPPATPVVAPAKTTPEAAKPAAPAAPKPASPVETDPAETDPVEAKPAVASKPNPDLEAKPELESQPVESVANPPAEMKPASKTPAVPAVVSAPPVATAPAVVLKTPPVKNATPVKLQVFPENINLTSVRDRQNLIAQMVYSNGITTDVSDLVEIKAATTNHIKQTGNVFSPLEDGETSLKVSIDQFTVDVPVKVSGAKTNPPLSFSNDVMPVFSKAGCNAGSCHGAARGKDGFRLSLYGFDPKGDYHRVTREMLGRRVNLAVPDDCLLITKATGAVPHSGGELFKPGTEYYNTLLNWLESGASFDQGPIKKVLRIELYPKSAVLNGADSKQRLTVRAFYEDGTDRDVTSLAYFSTNNDNSALISQDGIVTAKNRGEAFVMCRFDTHTVGSNVIVLPKDLEFQWDQIPENNYIDTRINEKLRNLRIQPSELCSDEEFIRRASIDICGIVPTPERVTQFIADQTPEKRAKYVDEMLSRKEFVEIWVMKWSELLQIRSSIRVSYKSTLLYYDWLKERIANNVPVNQMVEELLGSQGGTFSVPATNYYQNEQDNLKIAENVAQVFLGMRIQCAQCHNHPFDRWTMDDYFSFASFFAQVARKAGEDPREQIVFNRGAGETKHPVTAQVMKPKFLGGIEPETKGKDRRKVLAKWIASPENPYFAKNLSNIVWAHFFGKGIVDEVDDVRISNPAVNPRLLDELGSKFTEYDYDFKKLVRDICNSRTYQLSTKANATNETDLTNFSHSSLRRIRAEVLLDIISQVTETKNKFQGLPLGARAVQIADGNTSDYFLTTFGRAKRESVCSCEVKMDPSLSQALHLLNGNTVNEKIQKGKLVENWLAAKKPHPEMIDLLFKRCLGRSPTEKERVALLATVAAEENKRQALEDIFWALLNSREFVFNH
ncbi:MAG: DUF1549 domain-containing protein [Mariniblastus sp.]